MDLTHLFDPLSIAVVFGGTLLATLLRSGWRDTREALHGLAQLAGRPFDADRLRAELAAQITEINRDGLLRAQPHHFGDGALDAMADALIRRRSIQALHDEHDRHRLSRAASTQAAASVLNCAGELAPVLGLAGTLLSLGSLAGGTGGAGFAPAIGMAVLTTLYGLVLANFIAFPLSAAIQRRARNEEQQRGQLLEWLAANVSDAAPRLPLRSDAAERDAA